MHAAISGTIDFHEPDDPHCLSRLRALAAMLPEDPRSAVFRRDAPVEPARPIDDVYRLFSARFAAKVRSPRDHQLPRRCRLVSGIQSRIRKTLVCGYARLGGWQVGIVANQHHPEKTDKPACSSAA